jgi:ppGpp synthetase/RelA/SpoT-type nucleotidyltranferase
MPDFSRDGLSALLKGRLGSARYSRQIAAAFALAFRGHEGQHREQADPRAQPVPYIVHPVGVALLAAEFFEQVNVADEFDDVIAASLTHDLLEDTDITPYELERATSRRTLELVTALSRPSSVDHASHEQRNLAFLHAIEQAGKTAIFVKICDSLHNLSRPELTPVRLLEKTVLKGRAQYLDLIKVGDLGEQLFLRYKKALDEVGTFLKKGRQDKIGRAEYQDIDLVFSYCRQRTKRKVLEAHDVVEILKEVTGAYDVLYSSIEEFIANLKGGPLGADDRDSIIALQRNGDANDISIDSLPEDIRSLLVPVTRLVSIRPKAYVGLSRLFLVLLGSNPPPWVSPSSLSVLIAFLSERALTHEAGRVAEAANHLRSASLDLDPHLALAAGLTADGVTNLAKYMRAGTAAKAVLDTVLLTVFSPNLEVRVERRESRLKSPTSVLLKIASRKIGIEGIEDLVGYRFVVRNSIDKSKLTRFLTETLQNSGVSADQPLVRTVKTSRGYVAEHILCQVRVAQVFKDTVGVEIQVRTILDDAWARISQTIDYKKNNVIVKKNDRVLRKLRDMIDEIEKEL